MERPPRQRRQTEIYIPSTTQTNLRVRRLPRPSMRAEAKVLLFLGVPSNGTQNPNPPVQQKRVQKPPAKKPQQEVCISFSFFSH